MIENINVIFELEHIGWAFEYSSEEEIRVKCPFHEDESPSCSINVEKRMFLCHAGVCRQKGDIIKFLARCLKVDAHTVVYDLSKRYDFEQVKIIDPAVIERYHAALAHAGPLRAELYKRGVTDEDIREYRLGEANGRITIPIKNVSGRWVNVLRYLPGAPGRNKMRNSKGRGKLRLYPLEQLSYDRIVLCGGPIKSIVAARVLNPHGIGAVTTTGGEDNWSDELTPAFKDKRVCICLDIDEAGKSAAQDRAIQLVSTAAWVGITELPLDPDKYPKGDINDFVAQENGDLLAVIKATKQWKPNFKPLWDDGEEPTDVELSAAVSPETTGKRIRFPAMIAAVGRAPYIVPKKVMVKCSRDQAFCGLCPIFGAPRGEDGVVQNVHPESEAVLQMIHTGKEVLAGAMKDAFQIPSKCPVVGFETVEHYDAEVIRVNPSLEITNRDTDRTLQSAIAVGCKIDLNEVYQFTGRMHPHPKTQEATIVISKGKATADALESYKIKDIGRFKVFRPETWSVAGIDDVLNRVYTDLEANVTRIYQRRDLHLFIDLAYHSPLLIDFDDKTVKGWVEILIVGDSAQGKTDTAIHLMEHYGLGVKVECKNASVAGLLGGLQKFGESWMVTWGMIPTHDKRLVLLEELKGATIDTVSKLTDMRSSGIAEIPKIEKRRKHARTRLIVTSNPRSNRPMSSYNFGVEAISELIGNPEDVRRFDAALVVSSLEIDPTIINQLQKTRPVIEHVYTGDLCRELILWAWTRTPDQVKFDTSALETALEQAIRLCAKYTDAIPLVDRGSMRYKLSRLAASLACRTFSACDEGQGVLVRQCHVEYVAQLLDRVYSSKVFGYYDLTAAAKANSDIKDVAGLRKAIESTPYPKELCENLLYHDRIDLVNIMDWCSWDRLEAQALLSILVRKRAFVRDERSYRKNPQFIELLKKFAEGGVMDRPDFIPDTAMTKGEF